MEIQLFECYAWKALQIQGVAEGIVNILGGASMDYSKWISSYKHVSNFQWVWRYSCLNVTHKKPYKIQGVSEGIVSILGGGSMDYSE